MHFLKKISRRIQDVTPSEETIPSTVRTLTSFGQRLGKGTRIEKLDLKKLHNPQRTKMKIVEMTEIDEIIPSSPRHMDSVAGQIFASS
jgi:hypothetical protein